MKRQSLYDKLITQAQQETHPHVDVADDVMRILTSTGPGSVAFYRPLVWIASFSSAAAACIAVLTFLSFKASSASAMTEFYQAISWVAQ